MQYPQNITRNNLANDKIAIMNYSSMKEKRDDRASSELGIITSPDKVIKRKKKIMNPK